MGHHCRILNKDMINILDRCAKDCREVNRKQDLSGITGSGSNKWSDSKYFLIIDKKIC